jgi:hypothetical protein
MPVGEECEHNEECKKTRQAEKECAIREERKKRMGNRMRSLVKVWYELAKLNLIDCSKFTFNHAIAVNAIVHYIADLEILKIRYGIEGNAQIPKIAGLMASSILKYRPMVPVTGNLKGIEEDKANELLAIFQGICICANYYGKDGQLLAAGDETVANTAQAINEIRNQAMIDLLSKKAFYNWHEKFKHLVKERNYTSESLIMIFETLRLALFPNDMNPQRKQKNITTDIRKSVDLK